MGCLSTRSIENGELYTKFNLNTFKKSENFDSKESRQFTLELCELESVFIMHLTLF